MLSRVLVTRKNRVVTGVRMSLDTLDVEKKENLQRADVKRSKKSMIH